MFFGPLAHFEDLKAVDEYCHAQANISALNLITYVR